MLRKIVIPAHFLMILVILSLLLTRSSGKVSLTDLFPFGVENGDTNLRPNNLDDGSSEQLNISIAFPFFDYLHNSLWINVNGAISFLNAISSFTPICAAVPQNFRMIAPYWCDVDLKYGGNIFYRESFNKMVLQKATVEVTNAFTELENIEIKWAFLITYYNVSFYGAGNCNYQPRNTFQSVFASDGVHSFAIFYYNDITWTTGRSSSGNCSGLGGIPAKAGFDAGDGITLFTIPDSCSSDIIRICDRSNVGNPGKWVFRVDNAEIQSPGCITNFTGTIRVVPNIIDIYGHVPVEIIGPCFNDSVDLSCRFHDPVKGIVDVPGQVVGNQTEVKVVCIAPFIYGVGRIGIDVVLSFNGTTQIYSGFLNVISPQVSKDRLGVNISRSLSGGVHMDFFWNSADFSELETLQLNLYSYNLTVPQWTLTKTLVKNVSNTGLFSKTFSKFDFPETIFNSAFTFSVEPVQSLFDFIQSFNRAKFTLTNIFLAVVDFISISLGFDCMDWYESDTGPPNDLIPCPPTAEQADADIRFELDDACTSPPCTFHPGADFCIRSRNPSPSGGGQQCCYKDDNILIGPPGGGTPDKCHYKNLVGLCHLVKDVRPWIICCKDKPLELCHRYYDKRPSNPGTNYVPPGGPGGGTGDPHITTFDYLDYTFNGAGEFWMVRNSSDMTMAVQSRMEPFTLSNGTIQSATIFTAFVMKAQSSSKVQVQRSLVRTVDIYIDDIMMDLSNPILFDINYDGVQVSVAKDKSSVSVSFAYGFNFLISTNADAFSILATCDKKYKNKTRGLLGVYDGNKDNDLQDQNGNVISSNSSLQDIHYNFGLMWRILESESLFIYTNKQYPDYNIPNFLPNLQQPDFELAPQEAKDICGNAINCLYDYMITGSALVANQTKKFATKFNETVQIYEKQVITCPSLTYLTNGYYKANNFLPGSVAIYDCYTNYTLKGDAIIYCNESGIWNGTYPICVSTTKGSPGSAEGITGNINKCVFVVSFIASLVFYN